jgi:hypothetical protein
MQKQPPALTRPPGFRKAAVPEHKSTLSYYYAARRWNKVLQCPGKAVPLSAATAAFTSDWIFLWQAGSAMLGDAAAAP